MHGIPLIVTGYWFLDSAEVSAKKWSAPPDLVRFLETARRLQKKVVYIGFGSIVVSDPKLMTQCVIAAVVQSGVYAILSKGWSDRLHKAGPENLEPEEPLPKQIYPISSIPHDWLFTRIDAACHHGGAGTTGASLRGELNNSDGQSRRFSSVLMVGFEISFPAEPDRQKPLEPA